MAHCDNCLIRPAETPVARKAGAELELWCGLCAVREQIKVGVALGEDVEDLRATERALTA